MAETGDCQIWLGNSQVWCRVQLTLYVTETDDCQIWLSNRKIWRRVQLTWPRRMQVWCRVQQTGKLRSTLQFGADWLETITDQVHVSAINRMILYTARSCLRVIMSVTLSSQELEDIINSAVANAVTVATNIADAVTAATNAVTAATKAIQSSVRASEIELSEASTSSEATSSKRKAISDISATKIKIARMTWTPTKDDDLFIKKLVKLVSSMWKYKFAHYFVDLAVRDEFCQYMDETEGTKAIRIRCDHLSPSSGHFHSHVIVRMIDEERVRTKMANFSRWLAVHHPSRKITKRIYRVAIKNYVHLINTCLYIQTISARKKYGPVTHSGHTCLPVFKNEEEKLLFKRGPISNQWPSFLDDERSYAQNSYKRDTAYEIMKNSVSCSSDDSD